MSSTTSILRRRHARRAEAKSGDWNRANTVRSRPAATHSFRV